MMTKPLLMSPHRNFGIICRTTLFVFVSVVTWFLFGCNATETEQPAPVHSYPVTFDLTDIIGDIDVDSFDIEIKIGDGEFTRLKYNTTTGEAVTPVKAKPGDPFLLRFVLYSNGVRIGQGSLKGEMKEQSQTLLEPAYDSTAIAQVKRNLAEGLLLPANLPERFGLAVVGQALVMAVDSNQGFDFIWTLTPEIGEVFLDTHHQVRFTPETALSGKSVAVRVEAFPKSGGARKELRTWSIKVMPEASQGRLLRITTRNDTNATHGTLTRLSHDDSLTLREIFGSLNPTRDEMPVQVDSVQLDLHGRPLLIRTSRTGGETIDSSFTWSREGHLIALRVRQGSSVLTDTFVYEGNRLKETRHKLNESLIERMVHHRDGLEGTDTVFTLGIDGKWEVSWVFRLRFQGDHLTEKTWMILRNGLQAYRRETFLQTGLGSLLRYRRYREGETSLLEYSETWTYDAAGQVLRRIGRDEVLGQSEVVQDFTWETSLIKSGLVKGGLTQVGSQTAIPSAYGYRNSNAWAMGAWRGEGAGLDLMTMKNLRTFRANGGLQ
jgi:hypothetical protein